MHSDPAERTAEIFRSRQIAECDERAFMLFAVGIGSALAKEGGAYVLLVDEHEAPAALEKGSKVESH